MSASGLLWFNIVAWLFFCLPHIFQEDGNLKNMGWDVALFMPKKGKTPLPVPVEVELVLSHVCAILGSTQLAIVVMCMLAAMSTKECKALALRVVLFLQVVMIAMQFYKPSGTGVEGSPAMGPLPVMVALALPNTYGVFML